MRRHLVRCGDRDPPERLPAVGHPHLRSRIFRPRAGRKRRGPQGTLFGRSATSGVVNFITAKPRTDKVAAAGEVEYGNYDLVLRQGDVQPADRRHARGSRGGLPPEPRRLYEEP
ncbi:hypothetical protein AB5I41_05770 [Sphingomonas sp. MMS24-JH45]